MAVTNHQRDHESCWLNDLSLPISWAKFMMTLITSGLRLSRDWGTQMDTKKSAVSIITTSKSLLSHHISNSFEKLHRPHDLREVDERQLIIVKERV